MNDLSNDAPAWLEDAGGNRSPIRGSCSLGRSEGNQVTLQDEKVSRRHAVIQPQGEQEYWLVDFGSSNGTYLNGQRISQPTCLHDGDALRFGGSQYTFRQPQPAPAVPSGGKSTAGTVMDVRSATCWMLVADIIDSSKLVTEVPADRLPLVTGHWLGECQRIIAGHGGRINQFLGDGFFAFWHDRERLEADIDQALQALRRLQALGQPAFRVAVHLGPVTIGGMAVGEAERISGGEVHFVFRMEKLAGSLAEPRLLSEPARARLASLLEARDVGHHPLHGFDGPFHFYAF